MGGGLLQLVAYGSQDIYLTGNPQFTYFKAIYNRHTNFAIESIEQQFNGSIDFSRKINVVIDRMGDLLGNITLEVDVGLNLGSIFSDTEIIGDYRSSTKDNDYNGWLICDGRFLDKRDYPLLFDKIGYNFGSDPTNVNNFRLPDLRNKTMGYINYSSVNSNETVGNIYDNFLASDIDTINDIINVPTNSDKWIMGMAITFSTSGALPTTVPQIDNLTTYYVIRVNSTQIQITTTLEDALNGTNIIDFVDGGFPFLTVVHKIKYSLTSRSLGDSLGEETHSIPVATTVAPANNGLTMLTGQSVTNDPQNNMQPTLFAGSMFIYAGNNFSDSIYKSDKRLKDYLIRWGFQLIDYIELSIGGTVIDKHYGEWLDIWTQLTYTREKYEQLLTMVNTSIFSSSRVLGYDKIAKLYIPLQFWFCRNPGLYLPLIALQYHEVKLTIQLNTKDVVNTGTGNTSNLVKIEDFNYDTGSYTKTNYIESIVDLKVYCDFIYLDTDERRRFSQAQHEYLIEQVQSSNITKSSTSNVVIDLNFNHPCKLLLWRGQKNNYTVEVDPMGNNFSKTYFLSQLYDFSALGGNIDNESLLYQLNSDIVKTAKIEMNSQDRIKIRDGSYFRIVQGNQYISDSNSALSLYHNGLKQYGGNFYLYNFGLTSDTHQPSGTCNFSRIDKASLHLVVNPYASNVDNFTKVYDYNYIAYVVNYNILRIVSGMAGLAYTN